MGTTTTSDSSRSSHLPLHSLCVSGGSASGNNPNEPNSDDDGTYGTLEFHISTKICRAKENDSEVLSHACMEEAILRSINIRYQNKPPNDLVVTDGHAANTVLTRFITVFDSHLFH